MSIRSCFIYFFCFLLMITLGDHNSTRVAATLLAATILGLVQSIGHFSFSVLFSALTIYVGAWANSGISKGLNPTNPQLHDSDLNITWKIPYASGTCCIWQSLRAAGMSPGILLYIGIYPWTTGFNHLATTHIPKRLALWFSKGFPFGHVSTHWFPGARYGLPKKLACSSKWASENGPNMSGSFYSPPVAALGGTKITLTEVAVESKSVHMRSFWDWSIFPTQMVDTKLRWETRANDSIIGTMRDSEYERHFPQRNSTLVNTESFRDTMRSTFFFLGRQRAGHIQHCDTDSRLWETRASDKVPSPDFSGLNPLFANSYEPAARAAGQKAVSLARFMSTRGNKVIQGWEGADDLRGQALATFAQASRESVDYRQMAYRLWSRYLLSVVSESVIGWNRNRPGHFNDLHVGPVATGANARITWIHAGMVVGPNAANPEFPMWSPAAQNGLKEGYKHFVDASNLTDDEIIEAVSALDPMAWENVPRLNRQRLDRDPRDARDPHYYFGPTRYTFDDGTDEIFIHLGTEPGRISQARRRLIEAAIHRAPRAMDIANVIRKLATVHGAGDHLVFGLEAAMWRMRTWVSGEFPGQRDNAPQHQYVNADGNWELHLPRNYTASAYFDVFCVPGVTPPLIEATLRQKVGSIVNHAALMAHFRSVSLQWACFASTMCGRQWNQRPAQENNPIVRNHIDALTRTYNTSKITEFSDIHANAMAHQYEFAPSADARGTEAGHVLNYWASFITPTFSNHYHEMWKMSFMPTFQVLPYYDPESKSSHVSWPADQANPIPDEESFTGSIQLARDNKPFLGWAWIADGGYTRNAQFYAAQGAADRYRYQGGQPLISLLRYQVATAWDFTQAPVGQQIQWMGALNTNFSDFILPGSMVSLTMDTGKTHGFGIRLQDGAVANDTARRRWFNLAKGDPHQSLMINYIHPSRDKRAVESLLDYSTLFITKDNAYAGLQIIRHQLPNFEVSPEFINASKLLTNPRFDFQANNPDPGAQKEVERVTSTKAPTGARVAKVLPARITYVPKHPEIQADLPPMDEHFVRVDSDGMHLDGRKPEEDEAVDYKDWVAQEALSGYDHALEVQAQNEMDKDFQDFLAMRAKKAEIFKQQQAERDARIQMRVQTARARSALKKAQNQATSVRSGKTVYTPALGRFPVKPPTNVVPNDSAAGQAQAGAMPAPTPASAQAEWNKLGVTLNEKPKKAKVVRIITPDTDPATIKLPPGDERELRSPSPVFSEPDTEIRWRSYAASQIAKGKEPAPPEVWWDKIAVKWDVPTDTGHEVVGTPIGATSSGHDPLSATPNFEAKRAKAMDDAYRRAAQPEN